MAVMSVSAFRSETGRLADHLAASEEAIGHLRRLGLAAMASQVVAGTDVGTIATSINYENGAAYASGVQTILADEAWQEFWGRAAAGGSATQTEASLFSDVDPDFQLDPNRPLGVIMATQWRAKPGRLADFAANVMASFPMIERMGGTPRAMQCVIGAHPMTTLVTTTFADLDAYGAYTDTLQGDDEWQAFWGDAMADPTADMVRSGLYLNISG